MCDPNDRVSSSHLHHQDTGDPEVFLLDNHPGGVGISELGYAIVERVWERMRETIASCPCEEGCPRCVDSPTRSRQDAEPDKASAIGPLDMMIGRRRLNGNGGRKKLAGATAR